VSFLLPPAGHPQVMLMITQDAAEAIAQALDEEPDSAGFRIAETPQSLNGSGPALHMELAPAPEADDEVIEDRGIRLFVEPRAAQTLDGKVLDAEVEDGELRFALLESQ
jgi:iron-sulfur cluster assembly protein